ncbi:MAG: ABC transporter permease [Anaerolineales bacterium]|nr:MAG: ABC transporter permease [Anaerolineales bacterium]
MRSFSKPVNGRSWASQVPPVLWVLLAMIVFFSLTSNGIFFTVPNLLNVAVQGSVLMILGLGATCPILTEGTDLSLGSVLTLSGVVAVLVQVRNVPAVAAMLIGVATGFLCGAVNGFVISRWQLPPFIATLGMQGLAGGAAVVLTNASAIYADAPAFVFIGSGRLAGLLPMPMVVAILAYIVVYVILYHTSFGHYIFALGGNEAGSALSGVNTVLWKFLTYFMVGGLAGVAGVLMAARLQAAEPVVGLGWEFDAIAATILGGTSFEMGQGGITGTVLGVALIAVLRNGMNVIGVTMAWQALVIGTVMILAIVVDAVLRRRQEGL